MDHWRCPRHGPPRIDHIYNVGPHPFCSKITETISPADQMIGTTAGSPLLLLLSHLQTLANRLESLEILRGGSG